MRIAIVDDEKIFRQQIENSINKCYGKADVTCFLYSDGDELLNSIGNGLLFDAIFLDIEMRQKDGMSTAKCLRDAGNSTPIVFVTSHVEMAMEGYEVAAFRFLGKPIDEVKLKAVLLDLEKSLLKDNKYVIHKDREDLLIPLQEILYVESSNNNVRFVLKDEEIEVRLKLQNVFSDLSKLSPDFFKNHRSYVVNLSAVNKFTMTEIIVKNGDLLPIARGLGADFKSAMFDYVKRSGR